MNVRRTATALTSAAALSVTGVAMATPASAAPQGGPVVTGGLVNVTIVDAVDISRVNVQLPVSVAANVCDVDAAILLAAIRDTGSATCEAGATSNARN